MRRHDIITILAAAALAVGCSGNATDVIIPKPVEVQQLKGSCNAGAVPTITITPDFQYGPEGYILEITRKGIGITAGTDAGAFYAQQSLNQLRSASGRRIKAQKITDYPRFEYRGVHLDVSRHFHDVAFVKKQLEMWASLKLNRFHWHLTDGAGWRIQIDAYPKLTDIAAWRPQANYTDWRRGGQTYCPSDYPGASGGFYTKDEVREIVAFADSLHITVVPEIEMFGHSTEVTAVYPEVACNHRKVEYNEDGTIAKGPGVFCIGKEETFKFLETVLDEVIDLFPSEYIHIGGDEASKSFWRQCPDCQKRIKDNHLDGVDGLQSYGISRIERFVNSRGRQIIGWDEILEGGLAPNAAVMSWRGEEGGRTAAAAGHKVVMTPGTYCYLDKVQGNPEKEPAGFGGHLTVGKVYSYDPAPADMPGREFVMGVQTNLWSEMVPTDEHAEHMYYPRVFALAEIAWTQPELKDWESFEPRAIAFSAKAREKGYEVYDMTQGDEMPEGYGKVTKHLAYGCKVDYNTMYHNRYKASGDSTLVDGLVGAWGYHDGWQGWLETDAVVTIDLGETKAIKDIHTKFGRWGGGSGTGLPLWVSFEISEDGENFETLAKVDTPEDLIDFIPGGRPAERPAQRPAERPARDKSIFQTYSWEGKARARYIRVTGYLGEGRHAWLFTDEIFVN